MTDDEILSILRDPAYLATGYRSARSTGWAVSSDAAVQQVAVVAGMTADDARAQIREVVARSGGHCEKHTVVSEGLPRRRDPLSVEFERFFVPLP